MPTITTVQNDPARCDACGMLNDRSNDECVACSHPRDDRPTGQGGASRPIVVWGRYAARDRALREGTTTARAQQVAQAYGYALDDPDTWAVEIALSERDVDIATRGDAHVAGWALAPWDPDAE